MVFRFLTITLLTLLSSNHLPAQDISGKWTGNYESSFMGTSMQRLEVEIEIINDTTIKGYSYLKYGGERHEKYAINGRYNKADSTIYFSEDEEISVNLGLLASNVMGNYTMKLKVYDTFMRMDGKWKQNRQSLFNMMASGVWLEKSIPNSKKTKPEPEAHPIAIVEEKKETVIIPIPKEALQKKATKPAKKTNIQKTFEITAAEKESMLIEFTDNARLDNDIISVYINGKAEIKQKKISDVPVSITTSIPSDEDSLIVLVVAESYGAMPPCTVLMTVITNERKYTVNLASTYSENGAVKIEVKK